jgi:hypothetical protein
MTQPNSITRRQLINIGMLASTPAWAASSSSNPPRSAEQPKLIDRQFADQGNNFRQSQTRIFDLKTGRLGNLRQLHIRAENLAVIIRQGPENRVTRGSHSVSITPTKPSYTDGFNPAPQDLDLALVGSAPPQGAWVLIEVVTLQDLYLHSQDIKATIWIDGVTLPWLRIHAHEHAVALTNINIGHLSLFRNGGPQQLAYVATGKVQSLIASAQTPGPHFYLQDLTVEKQSWVNPRNINQLFALKIDPGMNAFYDSPIQTGSNTKGFEVQVRGDPSALLFNGPGRASVKPVSAATEQAAWATLQAVTKRFPV